MSAILNDELEFRRHEPTVAGRAGSDYRALSGQAPAQRFQSGRDLAFALRSALKGEPHDQRCGFGRGAAHLPTQAVRMPST